MRNSLIFKLKSNCFQFDSCIVNAKGTAFLQTCKSCHVYGGWGRTGAKRGDALSGWCFSSGGKSIYRHQHNRIHLTYVTKALLWLRRSKNNISGAANAAPLIRVHLLICNAAAVAVKRDCTGMILIQETSPGTRRQQRCGRTFSFPFSDTKLEPKPSILKKTNMITDPRAYEQTRLPYCKHKTPLTRWTFTCAACYRDTKECAENESYK